jgi:hypothetical protein
MGLRLGIAMRHLFSTALLLCGGALLTWVTATVFEYRALEHASSSRSRFVEPVAAVDTWGIPKMPAKAAIGPQPMTAAALRH